LRSDIVSKVWLIVGHQYRQEVFKRGFLVALFSLPLFLAITIGIGYLASRLEQKSTSLGYVDQAHLLANTLAQPEEYDVELVPFDTPEAARAALEAGQIDAFYVLLADYAETHRVELVYFEPPHIQAIRYFQDMVRLNLMADRPPSVVERALAGPEVSVRATDYNREFPSGGPSAGYVVPIVAAVLFVFLILSTSGYMIEAVVEEKENRTMEVIVSSVSTTEMMVGKIIGTLAIALTQLATWVAFFVGAAWIGGSVLGIEWLQSIVPDWRGVSATVIVALPSFLFIAALMTTVGATIVETQEAHQVGPLLFIPLFLPAYLLIPIAKDPNGPLAIGMSLFPLTSVMTIALRTMLREIPLWQIGASAATSLISGIFMTWLAGKAFRAGMLRYGKRLRWREVLGGSRARLGRL
jgi:ABC-2 type transport system permease protein